MPRPLNPELQPIDQRLKAWGANCPTMDKDVTLAVDNLPYELFRVIEKRYVFRQTSTQAAALLDISESSYEKKLLIARNRVAAFLDGMFHVNRTE